MSNYPVNPDMIKYFREDPTGATVTLTSKKTEDTVRIEIPSSHKDMRETVFHGPSSEIRNLPGYSFLDQAAVDREQTHRSGVPNLNYDIYGNRRPEGFFDTFRYFQQVMTSQKLWNTDNWKHLRSQELSHIHNPHVETYKADPISSLSITFRAASIIFIIFSIIWAVNPSDVFHAIPFVVEKAESDVVSVYYRLFYNGFFIEDYATVLEAEKKWFNFFKLDSFLVTFKELRVLQFPQTYDEVEGLDSFKEEFMPNKASLFEKLIGIQDTSNFYFELRKCSIPLRGNVAHEADYLTARLEDFYFPELTFGKNTGEYRHPEFPYHTNTFYCRKCTDYVNWLDKQGIKTSPGEPMLNSYPCVFDNRSINFSFESYKAYEIPVYPQPNFIYQQLLPFLASFFLTTEYYWLIFFAALTVHAVHGVSHTFMDQSIGTEDIRTRASLWLFLERVFVLIILGIL